MAIFSIMVKKKKALKQLLANVMLWLCVGVVIGVIHFIRGNPPNSPFPVNELTKLIDPWLVFYVFVAGFIIFTGFSLARHKSTNQLEQERATLFADLALDEVASALYNFGSLLAVSVYVGASGWYLLATVGAYGFGLFLKPIDG